MSRRSMQVEVDGICAEVIVGWDPPLCEFFAQVWTDENEDEPRLIVTGRHLEEVRGGLGKWDVPYRVWRLVAGDEARNDARTVTRHP